jgi:hypothetical protein
MSVLWKRVVHAKESDDEEIPHRENSTIFALRPAVGSINGPDAVHITFNELQYNPVIRCLRPASSHDNFRVSRAAQPLRFGSAIAALVPGIPRKVVDVRRTSFTLSAFHSPPPRREGRQMSPRRRRGAVRVQAGRCGSRSRRDPTYQCSGSGQRDGGEPAVDSVAIPFGDKPCLPCLLSFGEVLCPEPEWIPRDTVHIKGKTTGLEIALTTAERCRKPHRPARITLLTPGARRATRHCDKAEPH